MNMDNETLVAIRQTLSMYRGAVRIAPSTPISEVMLCGCTGPLPECKCKKRERLVKAFLDNFTLHFEPDGSVWTLDDEEYGWWGKMRIIDGEKLMLWTGPWSKSVMLKRDDTYRHNFSDVDPNGEVTK